MLTKVLVANRGEIAVRVMRTLRDRGIASVAVYSEADRDAVHVLEADEAVLLGPAEARLSYLAIERVIEAAQRTGADAIHPGYGFLSENADLAEACERAGIVFVGPSSAAIRLMGDKRGAKDAVAALGVPVVPGFHGAGADDDRLARACGEIGFPVIVKPAAGGGGKGMHVVHGPDEVAAALASARREALSAFGDESLLLEKYVARARHVEVQVLGDGLGAVVHLGTRDCSLQRRHQKVIEEAPAPFLPDDVRERMHADAVAIARSVDYRGVGTVEYVVDADDPSTYYFLEMNTRLQVEHPVTEEVTGLDLVELQLRVAAGEPLRLAQDDVVIAGHAVEARVYAEDGHHGFLPSSGRVLAYDLPPGVRIDSGVRAGSAVGTSYDPLLLKIIARGGDREAALDALDRALAGTTVLGLAHNVGALRTLLADPAVRSGAMTTSLIGDLRLGTAPEPPDVHRVVAAALVLAEERERRSAGSVWSQRPGWRLGDPAAVTTALVDEDGHESVVRVVGSSASCAVSVDGAVSLDGAAALVGGGARPVDDGPAARVAPAGATASLTRVPDSEHVVVSVDGVTRRVAAAIGVTGHETVVWIGEAGDSWPFRVPVRHRIHRPDEPDGSSGELRSPMPGSVVVIARAPGDEVREGEVIAVVEAMKMEYPLTSPCDGRIASLEVSLGAQVVRDQVVAVVDPA